MNSRQSGELVFCTCSVPAILLLPKLHPAAVVLSAAAAIGIWILLCGGQDRSYTRVTRITVCLLLLLLLGRAAQFTGISYPTAKHVLWMDLILLALAVYASGGGLERILRVSSICFPFLLAMYALIAVFSLKNINVIYPTGVVRPNIGYTCLVWVLLPVLICMHKGLEIRKGKGIWAAILFLLFTVPTILVWLSQSRDFADYESFPFYAMVETIRAFRIVERFEPILSAALTAGIFCLMSILCVLLRQNLKTVFPTCREKYCSAAIFLPAAAICLFGASLQDAMIAVVAPFVCCAAAAERLRKKRSKITENFEKNG